MTIESNQATPRFRTFEYATGLTWTEEKKGTLVSAGKRAIEIASPPEFKGHAGFWTPEDMFVGSIEMCQMLTFLALAQKQKLPLVAYRSVATGTLEFIEGQYRFTRVIITPAITVEEPGTEAGVRALLEDAHKRCLVANSIRTIVEVRPTVVVQEAVSPGEIPGLIP
jgi:organic hydroperoxide reductase OsmC/OhrA